MWVTITVVTFLGLSLLSALTVYCAVAVANRAVKSLDGKPARQLPDERTPAADAHLRGTISAS